MGKAQKKTGKGRLDKYYKLAKEQGYRARSAFKLIQLNKKYNFLESARCCIDLCAAPGGWLQVASKYMPVNSVIVGVDLVSIKPIPRVVTFACDITTPQCRTLLRGELKDWRADVVLHDGAPNVGTAWVQDAYSQSELVLMSLKLACEFLMLGGTFVTKVFRSADYNNLIWVFNQLFGKVEATKPPSSRNVSAEIFVVCREFRAPKHIDSKFFDPKHVFKDLTASVAENGEKPAANVQVNVFQPEKRRRKRDGYDEGDYTLFKKSGAAQFIQAEDPIAFLGSVNTIAFGTEEEKGWLQLGITTDEVKANCEDLKVLGKGDFKALMKWRTALREEIGLDVKTKETEELTETVEVTEEADPEQEIEQELERLNASAAARAKREKRRANELKQRTIQRMQLQMTAPLEIGLEQQDAALLHGQEDIFDLEHAARGLRRKGGLARLADDEEEDGEEDADDAEEEEEEEKALDEEEERARKVEELEAELDGMYNAYQDRLKERDAKYRVKEARRKDKEREEWGGIRKGSDDKDDSEDESGSEGGWEKMEEVKARMGESESDSDVSDSEEDMPAPSKKRRRGENGAEFAVSRKKARVVPSSGAQLSRSAQMWFEQDTFSGIGLSDVEDDEEEEEEEEEEEDKDEEEDVDVDVASASEPEVEPSASEQDDDDFEIVPQQQDSDADMWDVDDEDEDEIKQEKIRKHGLTTAEAVTLAQQLVNREKTKTGLINDGFNRHSLNHKDGLPSWFLDDEASHYKPNIPVTKEAITALRAKLRALDARPIKKIAEAKARKKMKAAQKLEKAMKKAEGVNDAADMTEREKAKQIERLMKKGMSTNKKKEVQVVVAKGPHKGLKGRPKGVKGRYFMVDARMRKELRAKKRKEKANKKRKRT